jgi:hypothetical protein
VYVNGEDKVTATEVLAADTGKVKMPVNEVVMLETAVLNAVPFW